MNYSDYFTTNTISKTRIVASVTQTVFSISYKDSSQVDVFLNGVLMDADQYTLSGNDTLTLENGTQDGDIVLVKELIYN